MPNGNPGDHPLTDILVHGWVPIGGGVEEEIRRIVGEFGTTGEAKVRALVEGREYAAAEAIVRAQQSLLRDRLVDIWNELILARRSTSP